MAQLIHAAERLKLSDRNHAETHMLRSLGTMSLVLCASQVASRHENAVQSPLFRHGCICVGGGERGGRSVQGGSGSRGRRSWRRSRGGKHPWEQAAQRLIK